VRILILIAITGASGVVIAEKLLRVLKTEKIETELIISKSADSEVDAKKEVMDAKAYLQKLLDLSHNS